MSEQLPTAPPYPPKQAALRLVGSGLLLALALTVVGWVIVHTDGSSTPGEDRINAWLAAHRTPTFNDLTHVGSLLSDTITAIALLVIMVVVTRLWLHRWREAVTLTAAIVGELLVFLIVTAAVQRDRPTVPHLDAAPPTSSFPSGHTAAAIALYGCIAVILLRELRPRWLAVTLATVCWLVPMIVAFSRVYRGMHHPTDVLFGFIGGAIWLTICVLTLLPEQRGHDRGGGIPSPPEVSSDELTTVPLRWRA